MLYVNLYIYSLVDIINLIIYKFLHSYKNL